MVVSVLGATSMAVVVDLIDAVGDDVIDGDWNDGVIIPAAADDDGDGDCEDCVGNGIIDMIMLLLMMIMTTLMMTKCFGFKN